MEQKDMVMEKRERYGNRMAIMGLVFGIVGLLLSCIVIGIIPCIAGMFFCVLGLLNKTKKKGAVIAGMITCAIGILIVGYVTIFSTSLVEGIEDTNDTKTSAFSETKETIAEVSKNDEMEIETESILGILGTDCVLSDLLNDASGKRLELLGTYWSRNAEGLYIFLYNERDMYGKSTVANFFVADITSENSLAELDGVSYEEQRVVRLNGVLDKLVVLDDGKIQFYMSVDNVEYISSDSTEAKKASGDYYYVGDSVRLSNGVIYNILDSGIYEDFMGTYAYVEIEIDNQGTETYSTSATNAQFYGDGYQLNFAVAGTDENAFSYCELPKGRKAKGRFYAECSNYNQIGNIEVEFTDIADVIIVIKDESTGNVMQDEEEYFYFDLWNYHTMYIRDDGTYLEIYPIDDKTFFLAIRDFDSLDYRDVRFEISENGLTANCQDEGHNLTLSVSSDGEYIEVVQEGDIRYLEGYDFTGRYEGYSESPE